jgi:hypothetical protein
VNDLPPADLGSRLQRFRIPRVVDEGGELLLVAADRLGLGFRHSVLEKVDPRALRCFGSPGAPAVLVIDRALVHWSAGEAGDDRRRADVVRMKVRDHDPVRRSRLAEDQRPPLLRSG